MAERVDENLMVKLLELIPAEGMSAHQICCKVHSDQRGLKFRSQKTKDAARFIATTLARNVSAPPNAISGCLSAKPIPTTDRGGMTATAIA